MGDSENLDLGPDGEKSQTDASSALEQDPPASESPSVPPLAGAARAADERRRRDKMIGLGIIAVTFVLSMLLSLWAKHAALPPTSPEPAPPTTVGLEGFPKKVDPLAVLPLAHSLTERPLFQGFVAEGVGKNGLIDFTDKAARLRFAFQSLPGQGAQPPREPGTLPTRTYCGRQNVVVTAEGIAAEPDRASFPCAARKPEVLPPPRCDLKALWAHAVKKGAPAKRRARVEYYQAQEGPAYRFSIPGTKHRFVVGEDCKQELKGKQGLGNVP